MIRIISIFAYTVFICLGSMAQAAQIAADTDRNQPIEITSQQLEVFQLERKSVFSGQVVAKQGDMTLTADELSVFLLEENNQIDRLEAFGNVVVRQLDRTARADKAVYHQQDDILTLTGHAQVEQGVNRIAGDEIILYVAENRSVVKSSTQSRVKATIVPETNKDSQ
jgi:lipopolysaccharide export system protein LptA